MGNKTGSTPSACFLSEWSVRDQKSWEMGGGDGKGLLGNDPFDVLLVQCEVRPSYSTCKLFPFKPVKDFVKDLIKSKLQGRTFYSLVIYSSI